MGTLGHSLADGDGVILALDESVAGLLHRSSREIIGRSYLAITHPSDHARNSAWVSGLKSESGVEVFHKRYLRADGVGVWLEVSASRLTHGLEAGRLVGTFHMPGRQIDRMPARLWRAAHEALESERQRREQLGRDLCGDITWAILLHLYVAEAEGRDIDTADMRERDGIPSSTLLRWLRVFEERMLVERSGRSDSNHQLSRAGLSKVEDVLMNAITQHDGSADFGGLAS